MNSFPEIIYSHSPVFLQNVMVSIYGHKLGKRRFGENAGKYVNELLTTQWLNQVRIYGLQEKLFLRLIDHAFATVPFYKSWAQKNGVGVEDIKSISDIQCLPIIGKDDIRRDPLLFVSGGSLKKDDFVLYTSGTTGKPLKIVCDKNSRRRHYAFWTRLRNWHGIKEGYRRATFVGRVVVPPDQGNPPFWRYDFFGKNMLFSSYHLSSKNLPYYYDKIVQFRPVEIVGYPSSIYAVAKYAVHKRLQEFSPKCIFTTAETLLPYQRETIEKAFNCKVVDQYGCTEMAVFISECEHRKYHVHPEHGYLELVDEWGRPVDTGQAGEAVCTGFVNFTMPLLRYRIGDRLRMSNETCPCGRAFPIVGEIEGRLDDILYAPDGRMLGRLDPVFKGMNGVYETQIVQSGKSRLEIYAVVDPGFTQDQKNRLIGELKRRTGSEMEILFHKVDDIPREPNGKFKAVVSNIQ